MALSAKHTMLSLWDSFSPNLKNEATSGIKEKKDISEIKIHMLGRKDTRQRNGNKKNFSKIWRMR